jgi:signal transduction histidine kinase
MHHAQRRPQGLRSVVNARFVRDPAARAWRRALASELLERVPLPMCLACEHELRIELANQAFRHLTQDGQPIGKTVRENFDERLGHMLAHELGESMRTGSFRKRPAQPDSSTPHDRAASSYDWLFIPLPAFARLDRWAVLLAYDVKAHVSDRADALRALRAAEQARNRKDEFLAQLAHELRGPLAPITATVDLLRRSQPGEHDHAYAVIERQTQQLTRLIEDLVDLSRTDCRGWAFERERVALSAVIDRALELAAPLLQAHRHGIHVDVANDLVVDVDPGRLTQVMSNLLTNAAKYMADGGSIYVAARRTDREIMVSVIDTGIGIDRDMLPRIFDRFVRAPDASRWSAGGLGLGLHIVRCWVREHGGSVEVDSDGLGRGSRFTVRLPAVPMPEPDCDARADIAEGER